MPQPKFDGSGKFEEFKANLVAYYFIRGITDEDQTQSVLIASLSDEIFQELQESFVVKNTPTPELLHHLEQLYGAKSSDFTSRYKFYSANRTPKEKPENWAARLVGLASNCKFEGEREMLIRDLFISRYGAGQVQNRLLEENPENPEVDLAKLVQLATMKEKQLSTANKTPKAAGKKPKAEVKKTSNRTLKPKAAGKKPKAEVKKTSNRTLNRAGTPKPRVKPSKTLKTGVKKPRNTKPKSQTDQPAGISMTSGIIGQPNLQHVSRVRVFEAIHMSGPSSSNTNQHTAPRQNANQQAAPRQNANQRAAPRPNAFQHNMLSPTAIRLSLGPTRNTQHPCRRCGGHHSQDDCRIKFF